MKKENKDTIYRVIRCYKKNGDKPLFEISILNIGTHILQEIFDIEKDNPMYDCYPIDACHYQKLKPYLKEELHLEIYDYFLELR